jgi:hypothetical protein
MVRRHLLITDSSNIYAVGYDGLSATLEVIFKSDLGIIYRYLNVPFQDACEFMNADSIGQYLAKNIKPRYQFEKITKTTSHHDYDACGEEIGGKLCTAPRGHEGAHRLPRFKEKKAKAGLVHPDQLHPSGSLKAEDNLK